MQCFHVRLLRRDSFCVQCLQGLHAHLSALQSGDTATLARYGRFVQPFAQRIPGGASAAPATAAFFRARYDESRRQFDAPTCVR